MLADQAERNSRRLNLLIVAVGRSLHGGMLGEVGNKGCMLEDYAQKFWKKYIVDRLVSNRKFAGGVGGNIINDDGLSISRDHVECIV